MVSLISNELNKQIKLFCCSCAFYKNSEYHERIQRGGGGYMVSGPTSLENYKISTTGTDPSREAIDPSGLIDSRGRSLRTSMKYVDDLKNSGPPVPLQNFLDPRMNATR